MEMTPTIRRILMGICTTVTAVVLLGISATAQTTTKEKIKTGESVVTQELKGTVVFVGNGQFVVKMSDGEIKTFTPPAGRTALIDGKPTGVNDLKVGTTLNALITTTTTSVTERTTTVGSGKVWYVAAPNVILTMPDGTNKQFKVKPDYKFTVGGKPATVFELRKGMIVSAEKIVEEPLTLISSSREITGHAPPPPKPVVAEVHTPAPAPAPAPVAEKRAAPAPVETAAAPEPAKLPKTASPLPWVALLGFLFIGASFGLRTIRRFQ
jgi:hypothetical protein